jgi:hypothetical protein
MSKSTRFSHLLTHTIRGKLFRLIWRRPPKRRDDPKGSMWAGQCDHPATKFKELWIYPDIDALELLLTVLHESTHGAFPDLTEEVVREFESDFKRIVKRMGIEVAFVPKK